MLAANRVLFVVLLAAVLLLGGLVAVADRRASIPDPLTDKQLYKIAELSDPIRLQEYLTRLLVPRVSGTESNRKVRDYIVNHFVNLKWDVQIDKFNDTTPHGEVEFANVIATKSSKAARRIIFAAHYDSKYFPDLNTFVGATDSAVPCAILMDLAYTLNPLLDANAMDHTLQFVFFDGEEAVVNWSAEDSLYGARHLAKKWANTFVTRESMLQAAPTSLIDTIDLFVLLDLMGDSNPKFPNIKNDTTPYYKTMQQIESELMVNNLLFRSSDFSSKPSGTDNEPEQEWEQYFSNANFELYHIDDDHKPFEELGVPIVHLIPPEFPSVWHQLTDNADIIDPVVVNNFNRIFRVFLAQYFGLSL